MPRFIGGNLEKNQILVKELNRFAAERGKTAKQIAIAWILGKGSMIVPLIGGRTTTPIK